MKTMYFCTNIETEKINFSFDACYWKKQGIRFDDRKFSSGAVRLVSRQNVLDQNPLSEILKLDKISYLGREIY